MNDYASCIWNCICKYKAFFKHYQHKLEIFKPKSILYYLNLQKTNENILSSTGGPKKSGMGRAKKVQ